MNQWINKSINKSINQPINQSIKNVLINQSINQSINQAINQSIKNALINQSINQSRIDYSDYNGAKQNTVSGTLYTVSSLQMEMNEWAVLISIILTYILSQWMHVKLTFSKFQDCCWMSHWNVHTLCMLRRDSIIFIFTCFVVV